MSVCFPQSFRANTTVAFLILLLSLLSGSVQAQTESQTEVSSKAQVALDNINAEIRDLSETLKASSGDQKDAIQFRLFNKNNELRDVIGKAVESESLPKEMLIEQVRFQQKYTEGAKTYLEDKLKTVSEQFNSAKAENKLSILNTYSEVQEYLSATFNAGWQNLTWLKKLGVPDESGEAKFEVLVAKNLRLTSASIEYFNQQVEAINSQLASAPEGDKAALQTSQLVLKQRIGIETDSLRNLIVLGDDVGLETSEYKRQVFSVTGNITQDILDSKVLISLLSHWWSAAVDWLGDNAPQQLFQVFIFILILFVTRAIVKLVRKIVTKAVHNKNLKLSHLMQNFFVSMSGNIVWIIGIMVGLSQIGLNLAPILTGFGIAGVIIGFALQDTLSNFAAGMMLLIYRPFDVGDFVFAGGVDGKVSHMSLVNTTIRTFDNQIIIVPNSKIWGDVIKNVTHERTRRVDMVFGIGYGDDLLKAESVLHEIIEAHPAVLKSPEPNIRVHTLNTSSVDFIVRPWVKTDDYWDVYWDVTKEVKLRFDKEGISIPFPQQDVHLHMVDKLTSESNA
ncbi:mechanosensitive ion channel family protein [Vibrio barjaei]|uniref:Small-conductance mechanosensitive channel n=1 Tax=Vibrio barjaei TaxID=1676683 RepID=A0ABW7IHM5_9VIBR|nr:mechanosensitive ion channel family protein [Vibrio barjaei]MCY9873707.1 mechanosensitive ion channel [Vibrio barjaei]OIN25766.1 mechanosensitive ion channel protein MscS [Vibrio barjaei]